MDPPVRTGPSIGHSSAADAYMLIAELVNKYPQYVREISDFQFDRVTGRGSFGEVWLANDLRTGMKCAVKELVRQKVAGRAMIIFSREVGAMATYHGRHLLKFVGFTVEEPYSIITEFMPNGDLADLVYLKRGGGNCSGTRLTQIAIGIIWGMMGLQRHGVLHRDLKAVNVLLDENWMPCICDYGVARPVTKNRRRLTNGMGTLTHMAPEVIVGGEYDQKVDVYSFGMILYEMSEGKSPYNLPSDKIARGVAEGTLRPTFKKTSTVPKCLKELMQRCWAQNPNDRPSTCELFRIFRRGEAAFKGTDHAVIEKYAEELVAERKTTRGKKVHPNPVVQPQEIWERLKRLEAKAREVENRGEIFIPGDEEEEVVNEEMPLGSVPEATVTAEQALKDPYGSMFVETLTYFRENLNVAQFDAFYKLLLPVFRDGGAVSSIIIIMETFCSLVKRDVEFAECLLKHHFLLALPLTDVNVCRVSMDFIGLIAMSNPSLVKPQMFRVLGSAFTNVPEVAVQFFAYYASKCQTVPEPFAVLDFMISYARLFYKIPCGALFVDTVVYLLRNFDEFRTLRWEKVRPVLMYFCGSTCRPVASASIHGLLLVFDPTMELPLQALLRNLSDASLVGPSASVLKRVNTYPTSKSFCEVVIRCLPKTGLVLLKYASSSDEAMTMVCDNLDWMASPDENMFRLFLKMFTKKDLRERLENHQLVLPFLRKVASIKNKYVLIALPSILKRCVLGQGAVDRLTEAHFFKSYLKAVTIAADTHVFVACLSCMDALAKKGYTEEYVRFFPIISDALSKRSDMTRAAIALLVTFGEIPQMTDKLAANTSFVDYFKLLKGVPRYKTMAEKFLTQIGKSD